MVLENDTSRSLDLTAGGAIFARLKKLGIDVVFANSGTDFPPIIEGLAEQLDAAGVRTRRLSFYSEDGVKIWEEDRGLHAGIPWPQYSIHRGRLQILLLDAVRSRIGTERVLTGHHLETFEQDSDAARATFSRRGQTGSATFEGDVLVGADGLNSAVRRVFHPDEGPPVYSGLMLWRGALVAPTFGDGESMFMAGHDTLKTVCYPLSAPDENGQALINWVAERPVDLDINRADWNREANHEDFVPHFASWDWDWINLPKLFADTTTPYEFPMVDRDPLERWSHGRVTLLGDAAHVMRPNGSNGSSQAILDGESLAQALTDEADVVEALQRYESERLPPTAKLTLDNRKSGPERVLQWVKDRCDGACVGQHVCVPEPELAEVATAYKRLAGFDAKRLQEKAQGS